MYKLTQTNGVQRLSDGAFLPAKWESNKLIGLDEHSPFVKELREWIASGNTPQAADPLPPVVKQATLEDVIAVLPAAQKSALDARMAARP